jgi:WW domain-binding protein 4
VAKKPPPKPSNPYANYTTAESLGYSDPDAERLAAELETRRTQGVAGDWYTVTPTAPQPITPDVTQVLTTDAITSPIGEAREVGIKRWPDALPEEDIRSFKIRKKTMNAGLGEIYDPGLIPIKVKKKEELRDASMADTVLTSSNIAKPEPQEAMATSLPRWTTKIQLLNRSKDGSSTSDVTVKEEEESSCCSTSTSKWAKPKWSEALPDHTPSDRASIFGSGRSDEEAPSLTAEKKLDVQVNVVKGEILGTADDSLSTAGIFKKRRAPNNVRRDRREI